MAEILAEMAEKPLKTIENLWLVARETPSRACREVRALLTVHEDSLRGDVEQS